MTNVRPVPPTCEGYAFLRVVSNAANYIARSLHERPKLYRDLAEIELQVPSLTASGGSSVI